VNTYLIEHCDLQPPTSPQYGLVVHSHGDFFGSISFPAVAELGLRVNKLGKSSCTYEIGLFERGIDAVKSVGQIIHVFVDRDTGRPAINGMDGKLRNGLQKLLAGQPQSKL
jgi:acyl-CoA thioester hydrolase